MAGSRGAPGTVTNEPEWSKNNENLSQDANGSAESLRFVADNVEKNRIVNITEGFSGTSSIADEGPSKICKPMSVILIRLPDDVVSKCVAFSQLISRKKKNQFMWKHGCVDKHKRRKYLQHKRLQAMRGKATALKLLQSEGDEKHINDVVKSRPDEILDVESSNKSEKCDVPAESTAVVANEVDKSAEFTEICETTAEKRAASESPKGESMITTENHAASPYKLDQRNFPEISDEIEIRLATEIRQDSVNAADDATGISSISSPVVSPEHNNNRNRKICLRRISGQRNSIIIEPVETRKRFFQSADGETEEPHRHLSKKARSSHSVESSEGKASAGERSTSELSESSAPIAKQVTATELSRCDPKFVRRRTKPTPKYVVREVRIILSRLEDSQDSLVLKWKMKMNLRRSNGITVTPGENDPIRNRLAFEGNSELGTAVAGVPITSLEDPSETLDASKRRNRPQDTPTKALSKKDSTAPLGEETIDEDDEEIVKFLRSGRQLRPTFDSSSSSGSSSSSSSLSSSSCHETLTPPLWSTKPLVVNASCQEKKSDGQESRKVPPLRTRVRIVSTDSSSSESACDQPETPKTPPRRREEAWKFPLLRTRLKSLTPDNTFNREEIRRPPAARRKAFQAVVEDSSLENTRNLNNFVSNEEASDSTLTYSREEITKLDGNESGKIYGCANGSVGSTSTFVTCGDNQEDDVSVEALAEVNCDSSAIGTARSNNHNEVLMARRKLSALKNAMVVLTKLEDLDSISEDNRYPGKDIEFRTAEDYEFSRNLSPTPDPLEINRDDNQNPLREIENSIIPFLTGTTKVSRQKTLRKVVAATAIDEGVISEPPESDVEIALGLDDANSRETRESDVEIALGLDDANSRETTESDVEMTLALEENSSQETLESDAESLILQDAGRILRTTGGQPEIPEIFMVAVDEAAESQDDEVANSAQRPSIISARSVSEGILSDVNSNSGDSRGATVHHDENLDRDTRGLKCHNTQVTSKCDTCRNIFKDAEAFEKHKTSNIVCNRSFLCKVCRVSFLTVVDYTKHRVVCPDKESQKQSSVDQSTNNETSNSENPPHAIVEQSPTKANQKMQQTQKNTSRKMRSKTRSRIDNLICGVCSINFVTAQALSEHIFKHNNEELQEAYRVAKAKALEDSQASNAASGRQNERTAADKMANKNGSVEANKDESLPQVSSVEIPEPLATSARVANNDPLAAKLATVCPCHRDKHPARPDKADLQIEMVLLCQHCLVIFRRRECFEVHYRTSPQCANDRTRGRWPRLYCANCQSTLNSWAGMRRHLEVHASLNVEGTVRFVCNICRVVFVGFGALFYNHWSSHLKDSMFVASRYSFPKNSVQPIGGIPKLPIGASSDETYILVAEHVCSSCKKPFSTKRDLETHDKSKCYRKTDEGEKEDALRWYCDICCETFASRRELNQHGKKRHGLRYLCVTTSSMYQAFMCTRCFAMKESVKDIEDHWRRQPQHGAPENLIETITSTERLRVMVEESNDVNNATTENQVPQNPSLNTCITHTKSINSSEKSKTKDDYAVIDIAEDGQPEIECVLQAVVKTPQKPNSLSVLRNPLRKASIATRKSDNEQRTKPRALEDPGVNIVLSGISKVNVSAKLVIDESHQNAVNGNDDQPSTDSYKIVMTDKQSLGNMRIVFDRTDPASSFEESETRTNVSSSDANGTIVSANERSQVSTKVDPPIQSTVIRNLYATKPDIADGKENIKLSKTSGPMQTDQSISALLKSQSRVPEIIDIADEKDEDEEGPIESLQNACKPTRVINESLDKIDTSNKSGVSELKDDVVSMSSHKPARPATIVNPISKVNSSNQSGTSNQSDACSFVLNTSELSFEEARLNDLTRSKQLAIDCAGAKKSGFLRVKNLSELQAVKTHSCHACNAAFESYASLEEHHQVHLCTPLGKEPQYPKGMTAALILPDHPKTTSTQPLPTVYAAGNVVTQQLIGLNSGLGVISGVPVSSVIVNNETAGSWVSVGNQHDPISSVALVNTTHSLAGGTLLMNLGGQQSTNNNASAIMATSIATSSATIAQTQGILAVQQQQQQQQTSMLGINQQLVSNNCSGQIGFHVLPAMVVPPTAHLDKHRCAEVTLRNTSTANLPISGQTHNVPFTYHSDTSNTYLCNICTTFRCDNIGTMNSHVIKHYTGFNNSTTSQNLTQSAVEASPNLSFHGTKEVTSQNVAMGCRGPESNSTSNVIRNSWFMRNTPQGIVWVTSLSAATGHQTGSSAGQDNNQYVGPSLPHEMNSSGTIIRGGQIVYRCLICKSAMYKTYPPLRNHVILVHGITDFISSRIENIVQMMYLCMYCAPGTAMYDTEQGLRQHIDSCHNNTCPTCRRGFVSNLSLKAHLGYCNVPRRDTQNASDRNS